MATLRRTTQRAVSAFAALAMLTAPLMTAGVANADPAPECPYKVTTPPAVDASEVPKPGETAPGPLPVPAKTLGARRFQVAV